MLIRRTHAYLVRTQRTCTANFFDTGGEIVLMGDSAFVSNIQTVTFSEDVFENVCMVF